MRFGLFIPQGWRMDLVGIDPAKHWAVMRDLAAHADDGAWDSLWVYDHFHTVPMPTDEATHEAWSLMSAYAATTSRIKLGQMCTAMSYRNPVYLAKVAATADIISGGRIQMGIGGGWYEHEWRAYGYGFPSAGVRLAPARRRRADHARRLARRQGQLRRQALPGRRRDRRAEAVAGQRDSAVDRRRRREGDAAHRREIRAVHQLHVANPRVSRTSREVLAEHCRDVGTDFDAIVRSANFNASSAPRKPTSKTGCSAIRDRLIGHVREAAADAMISRRQRPGFGHRHTGTGDRAAATAARPRAAST